MNTNRSDFGMFARSFSKVLYIFIGKFIAPHQRSSNFSRAEQIN